MKHNFIEASNIFLSEIELQLVEIGDFKKDKYKIQSLFEKFEDIELNIILRYKYNWTLIYVNERALSCLNFN